MPVMPTSAELARFSPFESMPEEHIEEILPHAEVLHVAKGTFIFKRGKISQHCYYLLSGAVDLVDNDWQIESVSDDMARCIFPLTTSSPTQVSAKAKVDSVLVKIEAEILDVAVHYAESGELIIDEEPHTFTTHMPASNLLQQQIVIDDQSHDWMTSLLQLPLFTKVPPAHIQQLFSCFETVRYQQGDTVVKEGLPGDYFYVVESGDVKITSRSGSVDVTLNAGTYFGEEALVGDTTRNASAIMLTDGILMRLGKNDFCTLLKEPILQTVTFASLKQLDVADQIQLLDIRLPMEYKQQHVPECRNIPLSGLRKKLADLKQDKLYVVTDDGGRRSEVAVHLLNQAGLRAVLLEDAEQNYNQL